MNEDQATNHIVYIRGGMGKNIIATSVIKNICASDPSGKIVVVSPYPDVWKDNVRICEVVGADKNNYIYDKFIIGKRAKIYSLEPYNSEDYFYRRKSLAEIWCDLYDIPFTSNSPEIFPSIQEINSATFKINASGSTDKPIFLIQTNGGGANQAFPISWARDIPLQIAESVCEEMKKTHRVIHLRRKDQPTLTNAEWIPFTIREVFALIKISDKRLFMDSFAQHASAAYGKPSTVIWVSNSPQVFGYDMHKNLVSELPKEFRHRINSTLEEFNITGSIDECPFSSDCILPVSKILDTLK